MTDKFKVEFLPEAVEFMDSLDQKSQQKIYYNIKKLSLQTTLSCLKNLMIIFGSLEHCTTKRSSEFLPFGTNRKYNKL